ncbi:hypothetical protein [Pseudomonas sp. LB3P14]
MFYETRDDIAIEEMRRGKNIDNIATYDASIGGGRAHARCELLPHGEWLPVG